MIIMLLAMTAVWSACTKAEEEPEYFNIDSTDIVLQTSEAGQTDILLSTNRDPVATVDAAAEEWLSAKISRRCLTLVYSENTVSEQRTGTVSVTAGSFQVDVTLTQAAYTEPEPEPDPDEPDVPVETEFPVYQEGGKNIGIVYWTSEDGKTSKVLSLARTESIPWSYNGSAFLGAADEDDGAANTEILKASAEAADIPALAFCESLGEGWYWPALNEMVEVFDIYNGVPYAELEENKATATPDKITDEEKASRDAFDLSLTTYGGTAMNTADPTTNGDRYWTSTELTDGDKHYGSFMVFGKAYKSYPADTPGKTNASGGRYARCIKVITNE